MTTSRTDPAPPPLRTRPRTMDAETPPRLRLVLTTRDGRCLLSMAGYLDAVSVVAVETEHEQLLRADFDEVVIDVAGLTHIDESGAVALAQLWARLRNDGVFCRVRGLHPVFADSPLDLLLFVRASGPWALGPPLRPVPDPDGPPSVRVGPTER